MNFFFSSRRRHTFFFQAEDGIRDRSPSRGLGDVYKRQEVLHAATVGGARSGVLQERTGSLEVGKRADLVIYDPVSYTHLTLPTICSV